MWQGQREPNRRIETGNKRAKQRPDHKAYWQLCKDLDFYSEQDEKPVEGFEQRELRDYSLDLLNGDVRIDIQVWAL